jgi:hypothetical protein
LDITEIASPALKIQEDEESKETKNVISSEIFVELSINDVEEEKITNEN